MGVTVDFSQYSEFFRRLELAATKDFKREFKSFLEGCAIEFLNMVQDAILERGNVDTRLMLNSFHKGNPENVWLGRRFVL